MQKHTKTKSKGVTESRQMEIKGATTLGSASPQGELGAGPWAVGDGFPGGLFFLVRGWFLVFFLKHLGNGRGDTVCRVDGAVPVTCMVNTGRTGAGEENKASSPRGLDGRLRREHRFEPDRFPA